MPVEAHGEADDVRQRINGSPVHALRLGPREHAVRGLVRAAVGAGLLVECLVRADGRQYTLSSRRPGVSFCRAHAVGADFLLGNVIPVPAGSAGTVVGRVLTGLAGAQALGTLVQRGAIPVGLAQHREAESGEVLVGKRGVDAIRHNGLLLFRLTGRHWCCCPWDHRALPGRAAVPE